MKLHQIIAVVSGTKSKSQKAITAIYHKIKKPELFSGFTRTYKPLDDDGETQPDENKLVQYTVPSAVADFVKPLGKMIDLVYVQDVANTNAVADVKVGEHIVLASVPVTHLLFLEKQLTDIHTFVSSLPVLDPVEKWKFDGNTALNVTDTIQTNRTKKTLRNHVVAEATDKHPAQVQTYTEDVKIGTWNNIKMSGAIDAQGKSDMLTKVVQLQDAVKCAREEANSIEVNKNVGVAKNLLNYIFQS